MHKLIDDTSDSIVGRLAKLKDHVEDLSNNLDLLKVQTEYAIQELDRQTEKKRKTTGNESD